MNSLGTVKATTRFATFAHRSRLRHKFGDAHLYLAFLLQAKGDIEAAIAEYNVALRLEPDSPIAYDNLGSALIAKQDWDGAERVFRKAVDRRSDDANARFSLGYVLMARGDAAAAIPWLEDAARLGFSDPRLSPLLQSARIRSAVPEQRGIESH